MRLFFIIATAVIMTSCLNDSGSHKKVLSAASGSLTRLAWEMRRDGKPVDSIIAVQKMAVEELRRGESADNSVEVLEQMGFLYNIAGDYAQALRFYEEATDSLNAQPYSRRNDGAIQLFGDISSLYAFLGMTDLAIEYSDSAIAESNRQGGLMLSDVYRFRAGIYELDDNVAKAMECYLRALAVVDNGVTRSDKDALRALIQSERAHLLINAYPHDIDSVNLAVSILEEAVECDEFDPTDRVYSLGLGYVNQGNPERGIPLLQQAAESYRRQEDVERINVANTALLETYAKYNMCEELSALVPRYIADADSMLNLEKTNAMVGAMVRYDIRSTEDRNRILALQLEIEREKRFINFVIGLLLTLVLLSVSVFFYQRNRLLARKRRNQEVELDKLSESNTMLNDRVDILERDLSAGMNSNSSILSDPQLITGPEEGRFRRAFNVLFPNFIPLLKRDYPKLTSNDELLCMLLYLKHTTEEIAVYLGISKASVNSARYRLRIKFSLPKDVDLDSFISSRGV